MLTFLSPEWIEALDGAGGHAPLPDEATGGSDHEAAHSPTLVIEQRVTDDSNDDIVYAVSISPAGLRVQAGPADAPDVRFTLSRPVAAAIAQGKLSAQAAFMAGDLRLGGDTDALLRTQEALTGLSDQFAAVRDRTAW